jgi:Acetyltransferase (GNAT) domain
MEYHRDRFVDFSLIARDHRDRVLAVLPASRHENMAVSHGGLTYGGFVSGPRMTTGRMLDVFEACLQYLQDEGIERLTYKCVPHIYHTMPAEEDAYALFVHNARLVRREVSSAIDTRSVPTFRRLRRRFLTRAERSGLKGERTDAFERFWPVLERNRMERHGTKPVHTLNEITYLAERFPQNIMLYVCESGADTLAGSVLYVSTNVCHFQYNAASPSGQEQGAMELIVNTVIERFSRTHRVIDFGISTERGGRNLNSGLVDYKEGFGARAVNYDSYELDLA